MILGHDFKYCIPEMDRLIGAAADMGIHFSFDQETISYPNEREHLIQIVSNTKGEPFIQLMVTSHNMHKREKTTI
jgi:hypothetical protein